MWMIWLLALGLVTYLVWRYVSGKGFLCSTAETPMDVLKKRYARGEITKEQFEQIKKDL